MQPSKNLFKQAAISLAVLLSIVSCGSTQGTVEQGEVLLTVPAPTLSSASGQQFIKLTAFSAWTLCFDFGDSQENWASVDRTSGSGNASGIVLSWEENSGEGARSCTLCLECSGKESRVTLKQSGKDPSPAPDPTPDPQPSPEVGWLELPALSDAGLKFYSHDMTVSGKKMRNYSFFYDKEAKLSFCVVYPLNKGLIGSGSRTEAWGYDPLLPEADQPCLYKGFSKGYDRGHQLPSADRLSANESTFYFTNMTPQRNELNAYAWATLEGKVRDWSKQMDTLYVVTGADYKSSTEYAYDNVGAAVKVPVGYFKALLGYKKSGSIGAATGGYIGIAFYFNHYGYSNDAIMSTQSMSIDALEEKLDGVDFFCNLPAKIGSEKAAAVESSVDGWWKSN